MSPLPITFKCTAGSRAARLSASARSSARLTSTGPPAAPLAFALAQARQELALPLVWNNQVWADLDKADDGLIWEIALFFEKRGLKEPAKKALQALQARPGWKDDPEWKAHWDALGR